MNYNLWKEKLKAYKLPKWDDIPDVDLYNDQVITIIDKYLSLLFLSQDSIITSSMINNYVKWKIIQKPNKKKQYNKEQILSLLVIIILKQVLNIQHVKSGMDFYIEKYGFVKAYEIFCDCFNESLNALINLSDGKDMGVGELVDERMAIYMACHSFISKMLSYTKVLFLRGIIEEDK